MNGQAYRFSLLLDIANPHLGQEYRMENHRHHYALHMETMECLKFEVVPKPDCELYLWCLGIHLGRVRLTDVASLPRSNYLGSLQL